MRPIIDVYLPFTYKACTWNLHAIQTKSSPENPHIVLLHGVGGYANGIYRSSDDFLKEYNCHYIDMPGFGVSDLISNNLESVLDFDVEQIVDHFCLAVIFYINSVKIPGKVILFGHSYGSYIASNIVCKYPNRIEKAIFSSSCGILPTIGKYGAYWAILYKIGIPHCLYRTFRYHKFVEFYCKWMKYWKLEKWMHKKIYMKPKYRTSGYAYQLIGKFLHFDKNSTVIWEEFTFLEIMKAGVPLSFIHGLHDIMIPYTHNEMIAKFADVPIYLLSAGHMPHWENPKAYGVALDLAIKNARVPCDKIYTMVDKIDYKDLLYYRSSFNIKRCHSVNSDLEHMLKTYI